MPDATEPPLSPAAPITELPEPPPFSLRNAVTVIGPGAVLVGLSIGAGEWLLGPAVTVKYGLGILWITTVSLILQLFLNMECARYTLATGQPILSGFIRLGPRGYWVWFWVATTFLQVGSAGWAGTGAGALAALYLGALPGREDGALVAWIGLGLLLFAFVIVALGHAAEHIMERIHRVMALLVIVYLAIIAVVFVPVSIWKRLAWGFLGFGERGFAPLPSSPDFFLLAAFAAYCGAGGVFNAAFSYWARDKGFGMSGWSGYEGVTVGGRELRLSQPALTFVAKGEAVRKWNGWWKFVAADQSVFWLGGALVAMALPSLLASASLAPGGEIRGLAVAAELARGLGAIMEIFWWLTLIAGAWILFSTQVGIIDGWSQIITDLLWSGSPALRARGNPKAIYLGVLAAITLAGCLLLSAPLLGIALEPILLIQLSANFAGLNLVFLSVQTLVVNRRLLPAALRPPCWREVIVVLGALFFGAFSGAWLLFSPEAKIFSPYVIGLLLLALLIGLGASNFSRKRSAEAES
jgi:hypothetical protein